MCDKNARGDIERIHIVGYCALLESPLAEHRWKLYTRLPDLALMKV